MSKNSGPAKHKSLQFQFSSLVPFKKKCDIKKKALIQRKRENKTFLHSTNNKMTS